MAYRAAVCDDTAVERAGPILHGETGIKILSGWDFLHSFCCKKLCVSTKSGSNCELLGRTA